MSKYATKKVKYYIEEINIRSDAKRMKNDNIEKIIIPLYFCKVSANSLAIITQFSHISMKQVLMLYVKTCYIKT